jgi:hypothetical protein
MLNYHDPIMVISRSKGGVLRHIGVRLPDGRVAHCAPGLGEHISTIEEFAAGLDVTIDRIVSELEQMPTLRRIAEAMQSPKDYDSTTNNCEMFANRVTGKTPESPQLQGMVLVLAAVSVLGLAAAG